MHSALVRLAMAVTMIGLAGCGGDEARRGAPAHVTSGSPQAAVPSSMPAPLPSAVAASAPAAVVDQGISYRLGCRRPPPVSFADVESVEASWLTPSQHCESDEVTGQPSLREQAALRQAGEDVHDLEMLGRFYALCAASGPDTWTYEGEFTAAAVQSNNAVLSLCPGHPDGPRARAAMAKSAPTIALRSAGRVFDGGNFLVGAQVQPGAYETMDVKNCYWERTDRHGVTIVNYFTVAARRVHVTITPSDFAFNSSGCGTWAPAS